MEVRGQVRKPWKSILENKSHFGVNGSAPEFTEVCKQFLNKECPEAGKCDSSQAQKCKFSGIVAI